MIANADCGVYLYNLDLKYLEFAFYLTISSTIFCVIKEVDDVSSYSNNGLL